MFSWGDLLLLLNLKFLRICRVHETLKILAAALKGVAQSGLDNTKIQRLHVVDTLSRTWENLLANFMRYRDIEKRLVE
jgi:hypothetical protein